MSPLPTNPGKGLERIPVLEPITTRCVEPRGECWPPEALAEMDRIWNTPDPLEETK